MPVVTYQPNSITSLKAEPKLVLLPFFRDTLVQLEKELGQMSDTRTPERRKSQLYGALNELLRRKI